MGAVKEDGFRRLRFGSLEEAEGEAERLAGLEREGKLKTCGSWTLGQALGHLAAWTEFGFEGFPAGVVPPWPIKVVLRVLRNGMLRNGMRRGVRIPRVDGGTVATEMLPVGEGLARYRRSLARLRAGPPTFPSPAFGKLTHDQAIQLCLRHSELHLGHFG